MSSELKNRTKLFSLQIIELVEAMPSNSVTRVINHQLLKAGTSIGANYRAACRARSDNEFRSKLNIVLEEIDECCFWLEIIKEKKWLEVKSVLIEANELTAIFVSSLKTLNKRNKS